MKIKDKETNPLPAGLGQGQERNWNQDDKVLFINFIRKFGKDWTKLRLLFPCKTVEKLKMHAKELTNFYDVH